MFEKKNGTAVAPVFCNRCEYWNKCPAGCQGNDACTAPENFDHYSSYSEKVRYWKESPFTLNEHNDCQSYKPKIVEDYSGLIVAILLLFVVAAIVLVKIL